MSGFISSTNGDFDKIYIKNNELNEVIGGFLKPISSNNFSNLFVSGSNQFSQLGLGSGALSFYNSFVRGGLPHTSYKAITTGSYTAAAIDQDDHAWFWGYNNMGQVGNGTLNAVNVPTQLLIDGISPTVTMISCGVGTSAVITQDNKLWIWGDNSWSTLGTGAGYTPSTYVTTPYNVTSGQSIWKFVACGQYHTAAIDINDKLWTWGNNAYGGCGYSGFKYVPTQVSNDDWLFVTCDKSFNTTFAIKKSDKTLWSWGRGINFCRGNGDTGDGYTISQVKTGPNDTTSSWKFVSACDGCAIGITTEDKLYTWGSSTYYRLGNESNTQDVMYATQILTNMTFIDASMCSTGGGAITTNGHLWTWGASYIYVGGPVTAGSAKRIPAVTSLDLSTYYRVSLGNGCILVITT